MAVLCFDHGLGDRQRRIISQMATVDCRNKHRRLQNIRHHGTGSWLASVADYKNWRTQNKSSIMSCYGIRKLHVLLSDWQMLNSNSWIGQIGLSFKPNRRLQNGICCQYCRFLLLLRLCRQENTFPEWPF